MNSFTLCWVRRAAGLLGLAFVVLLAAFAADAVPKTADLEALLPFVMHLLPAALMFALLALAWWREWLGAMLFPALGVFYIATGWGRLHWTAFALIAGPLFVLGALFAVAAWARRQSALPAFPR